MVDVVNYIIQGAISTDYMATHLTQSETSPPSPNMIQVEVPPQETTDESVLRYFFTANVWYQVLVLD